MNSPDQQRLLHTMLRVGDMDRSVAFYTGVLGMRVLRTLQQPEESYSLTFLGYEDESCACALELTYNYGISQYEPGSGFGHIAISVANCVKACAEIEARGGTVIMRPESLKGTNEIIAFVQDPDGYQIELIERG